MSETHRRGVRLLSILFAHTRIDSSILLRFHHKTLLASQQEATSVSIFACAGSLLVFFAFGALRTTWSFIAFLTGLAFDDAMVGVVPGGGGLGNDGGYWWAGIGAGADDALDDVGGAKDTGAVVGCGG